MNERPDREKKESSSIVARKSETDLSLHPRMTMEQKVIERISSTGRGNQVATNLLFLILDNLTGLKAGEKFFVYKCTGLSLALLYSFVH